MIRDGDLCAGSVVYLIKIVLISASPGSLDLLQIEENSGLDLIRAAMSDFPSDGSVCRASLSLLRNMCANDDFKAKLVSEGGLQLILGAMSQHKEDALLQVRRHSCRDHMHDVEV